MENTSPENTITAVNKAASVIETRGNLDALFPDLRKTFNGKKKQIYKNIKTTCLLYFVTLYIGNFSYIDIKAEAVQPVASKQTIILPAEGLESIQHCKRK